MTGIIVFSLLALLIAFAIYLVNKERATHVVKFDDKGLTTKSGKYHSWTDLIEISYMMTMNRYDSKAPEKIQAIHFHFKEGKAAAGYLMPVIGPLIRKADTLNVRKSKKITGYYKR